MNVGYLIRPDYHDYVISSVYCAPTDVRQN